MIRSKSFLTSSIGLKLQMAISGLLLIGFVTLHMLGNLQVFLGPEAINRYAHFLQSTPELLWPARLGLISVFLIHIHSAFRLRSINQAARPTQYSYQNTVQATVASRTMMLTGSLILLYLIGHILHFTLGLVLPQHYHFVDSEGRHDVYKMIIFGFQHIEVSICYIVAMLALGSHLRHAIASFFQTLGINHPRYTPIINTVGPLLAVVIVLGYVAIPISVLSGLLTISGGN